MDFSRPCLAKPGVACSNLYFNQARTSCTKSSADESLICQPIAGLDGQELHTLPQHSSREAGHPCCTCEQQRRHVCGVHPEARLYPRHPGCPPIPQNQPASRSAIQHPPTVCAWPGLEMAGACMLYIKHLHQEARQECFRVILSRHVDGNQGSGIILHQGSASSCRGLAGSGKVCRGLASSCIRGPHHPAGVWHRPGSCFGTFCGLQSGLETWSLHANPNISAASLILRQHLPPVAIQGSHSH